MKSRRNFAIILLAIFILSSLILSDSVRTLEAGAAVSGFELIAHRGFEDQYPENTIFSARKAVELGIPVEFDIQFTQDGEMVVIHDKEVDRTTNGTGLVRDLKYSYVKKLDAGTYFSKKYKNQRVPEFKEYLDAVKDLNHIYPELKDYRNEADIRRFTETIIQKGFERRSTILTFGYTSIIHHIREVSNLVEVGALCSNQQSLDRVLEEAEKDVNSVMVISKNLANAENFKKIKKSGLDVIVWTVGNKSELIQLRALGYRRFISSRLIKGN